MAAGFKDVYAFESRLMDIRTAACIVLAQSTGCRVHELGDAKVGCIFQEEVEGVSHYRLKASTRKIAMGQRGGWRQKLRFVRPPCWSDILRHFVTS